MPNAQVVDIAEAIHMAVAPVFLLTAGASFLSVLSTRLSRVVDRARSLDARLPTLQPGDRHSMLHEITLLERRRILINRAITACVAAALLVCMLIATAFLGALLEVPIARVVAGLFIAAMSAFVVALVMFLREILIASDSVRIRP